MKRPWITPNDVKEYTESDAVRKKEDSKLKFDIARAEAYIIKRTNNPFKEDLPDDVRMADIMLADAYARKSVEGRTENGGKISSETFDEYSYTIDTSTDYIGELDVGVLLDPYVIEEGKGKIVMRMRKL
ncbi:MAG: DUF3199 family protein [Lachnospiraceae bacterium]